MAKRLTSGEIGSRILLRPGPRQRACVRYESADCPPNARYRSCGRRSRVDQQRRADRCRTRRHHGWFRYAATPPRLVGCQSACIPEWGRNPIWPFDLCFSTSRTWPDMVMPNGGTSLDQGYANLEPGLHGSEPSLSPNDGGTWQAAAEWPNCAPWRAAALQHTATTRCK